MSLRGPTKNGGKKMEATTCCLEFTFMLWGVRDVVGGLILGITRVNIYGL